MLTGKDIHEAFKHVDARAKDWDNLTLMQQAAYDNIASQLNASYIDPLQEQIRTLADDEYDPQEIVDLHRRIIALEKLVKDYQHFTSFDQPALKRNRAEWHADRDLLHKRTLTLLGKEQ
jgi:hypothetical protein